MFEFHGSLCHTRLGVRIVTVLTSRLVQESPKLRPPLPRCSAGLCPRPSSHQLRICRSWSSSRDHRFLGRQTGSCALWLSKSPMFDLSSATRRRAFSQSAIVSTLQSKIKVACLERGLQKAQQSVGEAASQLPEHEGTCRLTIGR